MNERGLLQSATESPKDFLGSTFGACEHDRLLRSLLDQQPDQDRELSVVIDSDVVLVDGVTAHRVDRHVDPLGGLHVALSESFNGSGKGGRQQHRLPFGRASSEDSFDVRTEADIQHAVGFIEDDDLQMV